LRQLGSARDVLFTPCRLARERALYLGGDMEALFGILEAVVLRDGKDSAAVLGCVSIFNPRDGRS
jgi:hypothetical protein